MAKELALEDDAQDHRTIQIWLAIIVGSLAFSSVVMFWTPGATGFLSYDTGPEVNLNPDFVNQEDYSSHLTTTLLFVGLLIALQIGLYAMVTRFYDTLG